MLASIEYLAQRAFVALSVTDDDDGKEEGAARVGRDLLRIFHRGLGDEMRAALAPNLQRHYYTTGLNTHGDVCARVNLFTPSVFEEMFPHAPLGCSFATLREMLTVLALNLEDIAGTPTLDGTVRFMAPVIDVQTGDDDGLPAWWDSMPVALAHADGAQHRFFPLRAFPQADTVICLWDGRPETDAKPEIAPRLLRLPIEAVQPVLSRRRRQVQQLVSAKINRRPGSLRRSTLRGFTAEVQCPEHCIVSEPLYAEICTVVRDLDSLNLGVI